ncbi:MAG: cupin domain-containing protein [Jiangellaceae bacterium]
MTTEPLSLDAALASFDAIWSPRIVAQINDYDVRVAKVRGDFVWHVHEDTDEFFLVLDGTFDIALREPGHAECTVRLNRGDVFVVPRGAEHRPSSSGASILMFERTGTSNTGDRHDDIPDYADSTTGHGLALATDAAGQPS